VGPRGDARGLSAAWRRLPAGATGVALIAYPAERMDSTNARPPQPRRFLFRLDGSKDNDAFFAARQARDGGVAYSGTPMKVGRGWIPDLVEVAWDQDRHAVELTLVELEATETAACAACRKYLPEASNSILAAFASYLDAVIAQCNVTADPRTSDVRELRNALELGTSARVRTAGALRSDVEFVEEWALIDQAERSSVPAAVRTSATRPLVLDGQISLTRGETDGLRRAIRVIYAVVIGLDRSAGTLGGWCKLPGQPLNNAGEQGGGGFPELRQLLVNQRAGTRVDSARLVAEMAQLCAASKGYRLDAPQIATVLGEYAPVVQRVRKHEAMNTVFEQARVALRPYAVEPTA